MSNGVRHRGWSARPLNAPAARCRAMRSPNRSAAASSRPARRPRSPSSLPISHQSWCLPPLSRCCPWTAYRYDAAGERFLASITVSTDAMQTQRMRVSGRVLQMVSAVVATRRLQADEIIGPADVRPTSLPARRLAGPVIAEPGLAIGQIAQAHHCGRATARGGRYRRTGDDRQRRHRRRDGSRRLGCR